MFELILSRTNGQLRILGATSGDTGSAAIYGVRGKPRIDCVRAHGGPREDEARSCRC